MISAFSYGDPSRRECTLARNWGAHDRKVVTGQWSPDRETWRMDLEKENSKILICKIKLFTLHHRRSDIPLGTSSFPSRYWLNSFFHGFDASAVGVGVLSSSSSVVSLAKSFARFLLPFTWVLFGGPFLPYISKYCSLNLNIKLVYKRLFRR